MTMNDYAPDYTPQEEEFDLLVYWRTLVKHRWSIIGLAFAAGLLATLIAYNMTPIYRSAASIMIQTEKAKILSIEDIYNGQQTGEDFFNTQVEVLKSRDLAERVVKKLDLVNNPVMDPRQVKPPFWKKWLLSETVKPISDIEATKIVTAEFEGGLTIEPVVNSQIIKISYDSPDKKLAAEIPNALAEAYIESDLEAKVQMTQKANSWLTQRMGELRAKLEASEQALQSYREQANIVDTKGIALNGAGKQLDEISSNLINARQRLSEAESAYNQVRNLNGQPLAAYESVPAVLKNALFLQAKDAESKAEQKVAELSQRYASLHPKMIAAQSDLKAAKDNLRMQIDAVVGAIQKEYEMAKANEVAAQRAQGQVRSDIQVTSKKEFQLNVLQRDVDSNRQLYELFMNRAKETNVGASLQSTIARIIDPSIVSDRPFKPQKGLIVGVAIVLGLMLGVMLAFLLEYLDNTVKNREDVENKIGLNVLGSVQMLEKSGSEPKRAFLDEPGSSFSESIRSIRTGVLLSALDDPHKVIMVTSSVPQEGKSTISVNLAFALGQMKKVLLLEADLRRPSIGKVLHDDPSAPGLLDFLAGTADLKSCIHKTANPNVFLIPSGQLLTNPLELLSSRRFGEMIDKLSETFEMVVIDSPPVVSVSDSLVLSGHVSAVVYIVRADETPYQLARAGIRRLQDVNAPLLGIILNGADIKQAEGYGAYGYGYGGYGEAKA